jgi:hypothetical protein
MNAPPDYADRLHRLILRAYPPEYLETFGEEMHETFLDGVTEARSQGRLALFLLQELRDTPKALANAYWDGWKRKAQTGIQILQEATSTSDLPPAPPDGRDSWKQVVFECGLFIITALLLITATYFPIEGVKEGWQRSAEYLGRIIVPLTLPILLFGLVRGLPRWAYPFGGLLLGYYAFVSNQTALGVFLLILLFGSTLLALAAILTDPQPTLLPILFRRIGQSISTDWMRLSFAVYGAMPLFILMAFDDSHYDNRTPFLALAALTMAASAFLYCRSRTESMQMLALFLGMTLSIGCAWLDQISFANRMSHWIIVSSRAGAGNLWLFSLWIQWNILLLSPGILLTLGRNLSRKPGSQTRHEP